MEVQILQSTLKQFETWKKKPCTWKVCVALFWVYTALLKCGHFDTVVLIFEKIKWLAASKSTEDKARGASEINTKLLVQQTEMGNTCVVICAIGVWHNPANIVCNKYVNITLKWRFDVMITDLLRSLFAGKSIMRAASSCIDI